MSQFEELKHKTTEEKLFDAQQKAAVLFQEVEDRKIISITIFW